MSLLSRISGIGINPFGKTKIKIDPLKALGTIATVGSMGSLGPLAGIAGKLGSVASSIPGVGALGGLASKVGGMIPGPVMNAGKGILNAVEGGGAGAPGGAPGATGSGGVDYGNLLKLALGGAAGISGYNTANAQAKQATNLTNKSLGIADRLTQRATSMNNTAQPLTDASASGLLARIKAGPRAPVDYTQFNDKLNPFSKQFAPAPAAPAAAPIAAAPPPAVLPPPPPSGPALPRPRKLLTAGAVAR